MSDIVTLSQPLIASKYGTAYDEVWVLPYIPVHEEGPTQLIDSFTEI